MITLTRSMLCALVLAAGLTLRAGAQTPAGRVIVLDNEHTLEGEIDREGDQYHIRRGSAEIWLPASKVVCLCNTMPEAYQFVKGRANLRDPDERLRLAHWCYLHNLRAQALAETTAALELSPRYPPAVQLLHSLQQSAAVAATKPQSPPTRETVAPPPVDMNPEALGPFGSRVQPILMNTCASCHAGNLAGSFRLERVFEGGIANRRATQHNLAAVLAQLNPEQPLASPLLIKAVTVHGDLSQAPLKGRQTPAYRTLEDWVRLAVDNVRPREVPTPPAPETKAQPTPIPAKAEPASTEAAAAKPSAFAAPEGATPPAREPTDPFDPLIFNRQMHPPK